ncbi:CocE/NonD family hydrolase [Wenxinia saemankumensis]|uniref:Xaa-Pro dipeptidyl-peptidase C-terminal domain-containing protein n=1 Tax=Wenxinia saemankumensis TaxID=1447782 RepID=A0A1M6B551_9RHOB|nr:CocE/NonD family hydrolase [Wenxinia saemankumensis]SHI43909.1 hypothetical protein SAMN05444417_0786 [Wenxinia saemankumensis]
MGRFIIEDGVEMSMRDGTILRGDIWRPEAEGPCPVLLQRTPYRREDAHGAQFISALNFQSALRRGYAICVQDTRGRYGSEGMFDPFVHEAADGADTIAWLRAQDWCDGRVAMFGASYVGATQVLAASARPEGLAAISPQLTTARHGETWCYRGGAVELGFLMLWIIEALAPPDLERRLKTMPPAEAARARETLARLQADPHAAFSRDPELDADLFALAPYAKRWFDEDRAMAAGEDREHLDRLAACNVPMLVTAGWNDIFVEGSIELFETARSRHAGVGSIRDRLVIGPWSHGNPHDWQGDHWLGYGASTVFLSDRQLDFFDAVLNDRPPAGLMVHYFRTGSNTWHEATDWPIPGTRNLRFHLDGVRLDDTAPSATSPRRLTHDPADPVPTTGGASFLPGLLLGRNSGPKDQAGIEARDDVLLYTGAPLASDLEVTGRVSASLEVRSTPGPLHLAVRLCDVAADGRSVGIVDGIVRWNGTEGRVEVTVGHCSHLFRTGHRIRIQLAASNYPRFDLARKPVRPDHLNLLEILIESGHLDLPTLASARD